MLSKFQPHALVGTDTANCLSPIEFFDFQTKAADAMSALAAISNSVSATTLSSIFKTFQFSQICECAFSFLLLRCNRILHIN